MKYTFVIPSRKMSCCLAGSMGLGCIPQKISVGRKCAKGHKVREDVVSLIMSAKLS